MSITHRLKSLHFIKDDQGQIVIWQWPNFALYSWFLFKVLSLISNKSSFKIGFENISKTALFTWAFLEITQGVNYFRRLLGLAVMLTMLWDFFK